MAEHTPVKIDPAFGRDFAWTPENAKVAAYHISKYPAGKHSAVMPLLRQAGLRR